MAALRGQRPMISIDPKAVEQIGAVKQAVVGLRKEIKTLADEAQRYATAMGAGGGAGRGPGRGGGQRPPNFPAIMQPGQGGGDRQQYRGQQPGFDLRTAVLLPQITQLISGQIGALVNRERVTSRLAMAQTGPYTAGMAGPWQQMIRQTPVRGGYTSTGDLYAGAQTLGTLGLMRSANDPNTRRAVTQASQLALLGGTNFQGAAGAMGTFMSPQTVNALRQRGINPTPGGQLNMLGRSGVMEQLYTSLGGQQRGEDFWRTGLRPGSPLSNNLQAMGLGQQEQGMVQQYGLMRAEGTGAGDVEKQIAKRYHDTGENLDELRGAMSKLRDSLSNSLVPLITNLAKILVPVLDAFGRIIAPMTNAQKGIVALGLASLLAAKRIGLGGGKTGGGGAGTTTAEEVGAASAGARSGLGVGGGLVAGAAGGIGGSVGASLGRKAGGQGWLGKAGSTLGGLAGGVLAGGLAGGIAGGIAGGGIFDWATVPAGAVIGGVGGLISGIMGDAWSEKGDAYSDSDLIAHPPAPAVTPGGGPLPGAGNSSNLNPDFVKRLQSMFAANPRLRLTSGWRSHQEQAYLRWQLLTGKRKAAVAPVGKSRHESGNAADIGPSSEYDWLKAHASEFGVANVGAQFGEAWHYEPIGLAGTSAPAPAAVTATAPAAGPTKSSSTQKIMSAAPRPANSMNVVDVEKAFFSGGGYAPVGVSGQSDTGDPVGTVMPAVGVRGTGDITIHTLSINLTIAKGTYEEAEKTARYLGQILSDRDRLMALAKK